MWKCHQNSSGSSSSSSRHAGAPQALPLSSRGNQMAHAQSYLKASGRQLSPCVTLNDECRQKGELRPHVCCNVCFPISKVTHLIAKCLVKVCLLRMYIMSSLSERGNYELKTFNLTGGLTNRPPTHLPIRISAPLFLGGVELGGQHGLTITQSTFWIVKYHPTASLFWFYL